ncbi:MAG: electron transport complex subunit RsxA, partial [Clostridia bacterium]|nr:electron transport complex subunit RsxA [Clostridia bacterium]
MTLTEIFALSLGAILIENYIFVKFLGICSFLGVSKKMDTAFGMGMAVVFVMTVASAVTYVVNKFVLVPLNIGYMQTVAFILVIASLVQFVEMLLMKMMPALYQALGIFLPLITTNCAILGAALLNITNELNFIGSVIYGFSAGIGFTLA